MRVNSYEYILVFLPLTLWGYFALNRRGLARAGNAWLLVASLVFYGWWSLPYLPLILASTLFNFVLARALGKPGQPGRRALVVLGVAVNLSVLGYYKYAGFLAENLNFVAGTRLPVVHHELPVGISFFTFTQVSYIVDAFRLQATEHRLRDYALFVSYFPHIIAGPILHHKEMLPQFESRENKRFSYDNVAAGLFLFFVGLCKKVVVSDTFADWADAGFDVVPRLSVIDAWITSLSYTFQVYFDFSGYSDMAIGASLLLGIHLPINFTSPYRAGNLQDWWRRWHMTLSRFLRDYVYIPLGGSRQGELRTYVNIMITFILCGLWHGAAWTFIFWGFLQGVGLAIHREWRKRKVTMPYLLGWLITFNYGNISMVPFRAARWSDAIKVLRGMFGLDGFLMPDSWKARLSFLAGTGLDFGPVATTRWHLAWMAVGFAIVMFPRSSMDMLKSFKPTWWSWVATISLATCGLASIGRVREFLYFHF